MPPGVMRRAERISRSWLEIFFQIKPGPSWPSIYSKNINMALCTSETENKHILSAIISKYDN